MRAKKAKQLRRLALQRGLHYKRLKRVAVSWRQPLDLRQLLVATVVKLGELKRRGLAILDAEAAQQERSHRRYVYRLRRWASRR